MVVCAWMGAQVHWSSFVVTTVIFVLVHPFVAWKSRENPWAVAMFVAYVRRPVLYSNRAMLGRPCGGRCVPFHNRASMLVPLLALAAGAAGARFLARVSSPPRSYPSRPRQLGRIQGSPTC